MDFKNISKILAREPAYRQKQVNKAIFFDLIEDWEAASTLSKELRARLTASCPLEIEAQVFWSDDKNSAKAVIKLEDGKFIETVLMKHHHGRNTVCVSSQVGCALACDFCATGSGGFLRNLTAEEIVAQVLFFARLLKKEKQKITNVVFMGMGEPFMNYEKVLLAINWLNDKDKFNLGSRHLSVSTVGIVPGIKKFTKEPLQVNLAISLHAPNDELRDRLMPINIKYPLKQVLTAAADYIKKTNRRLMLEYLMLKDINDSEKHARELAKVLKASLPDLFFVNLISYNPTGKYQPSAPARIKKFQMILAREGISTIQRFSFGRDIKAACGQLIKKTADRGFSSGLFSEGVAER